MLIVVSPAKSLDVTSKVWTAKHSEPRLLDRSSELVERLAARHVDELQDLLSVSPELAELNARRYGAWTRPFTRANARPAIFTFHGDTYVGLDAPATFNERDLTRAQKTLRILSGLYGVLRPLDLIQAYRLDMGTKLPNSRGSDLYRFWGDTLSRVLADDLASSPGGRFLVNLASAEYFRALNPDLLGVPVVTPRFLDYGPNDHDGAEPKVISFHAKRARGAMAGWLIRERIESRNALATFDGLDYEFDRERSSPSTPTFIRRP